MLWHNCQQQADCLAALPTTSSGLGHLHLVYLTYLAVKERDDTLLTHQHINLNTPGEDMKSLRVKVASRQDAWRPLRAQIAPKMPNQPKKRSLECIGKLLDPAVGKSPTSPSCSRAQPEHQPFHPCSSMASRATEEQENWPTSHGPAGG